MPDYLALIDRETDGGRCDVTPLFRDAQAFQRAVDDLLALARESEFTVVAGIDALGFILGAAMALQAGTGFAPIRKAGKLPVASAAVEFDDYDGPGKVLEIRLDAFEAGDRVLVVDEWIETGAQALAAITLVGAQGATVAGVATIHCDGAGEGVLLAERIPVFALERDPGGGRR